MYSKSILLFLLFWTGISPAQYIKVTKILDSNLFEIEDGRQIKLAGIDAPNSDHPQLNLQNLSNDAIYYCAQNILDRRVFMEIVPDTTIKSYNLAFLHINYLFEKVNYNTKFLMYGYGKFINNVRDLHVEEMVDAETYARKYNKGLWQYIHNEKSDTLDKGLTGTGIRYLIELDSQKQNDRQKKLPLSVSIPFQIFSGTVMTAGTALGIGIIYSFFSKEHGRDSGYAAVFYGLITGYWIGFPSGVYLAVSSQNPNLSYWKTLGVSSGCTLLTTGISYLLFRNDQDNPTIWIALLTPIISSLLYTNLFPHEVQTTRSMKPENEGLVSIKSHQNFYNSTINFKMELLRVNF
jgi:hypothetical protein